MIVILKKNAQPQQIDLFDAWLHNMGLETHKSVGANHTIIGLVGDTSRVDMESILALDIVEAVRRIQEPYKNANRKFHEDDTITIDLHIMVDHGVNLPAVAASIMEQVKYVVNKCTGTEVRAVNVHIDSILEV